jgi:hypothetical protein
MLLSILLLFTSWFQDKYEMRWKLEKGDRLGVEVKVAINAVSEQAESTLLESVTEVEIKDDAVKNAYRTTVRVAKAVVLTRIGDSRTLLSYERGKEASSPEGSEEFIKLLKGDHAASLSRDGLRVGGDKAVATGILPKLFGLAHPRLPEQAVGIGDEWDGDCHIPFRDMDFHGKIHYKVDKLIHEGGGDIAEIHVNIDEKAELSGKVGRWQGDGKLLYSLVGGMPREFTLELVLKNQDGAKLRSLVQNVKFSKLR